MPGSLLNCRLTSSTSFDAALDTPLINCPVIMNGINPPTNNPTIYCQEMKALITHAKQRLTDEIGKDLARENLNN